MSEDNPETSTQADSPDPFIDESETLGGAELGDLSTILRIVRDEPAYRVPAENLNLRVGQLEIFHVVALNISELVVDDQQGLRIIQRLRAADELFLRLENALIPHIDGCIQLRPEIEERMDNLRRNLGGKAVWTDQFLEKFAPIQLPTTSHIVHNQEQISPRDRISSDARESPLHHVRFVSNRMQIFRDGSICYTMRSRLEPVRRGEQLEGSKPTEITQVIERLAPLRDIATRNFREMLAQFLDPQKNRDHLRKAITDKSGNGLELIEAEEVRRADFGRKVKAHTAIFVEEFYRGVDIDLKEVGVRSVDVAKRVVRLHEVLASADLAGILNVAPWYQTYNSRYVRSLTEKEIGYRSDEIYLTDRNATVAVSSGFFDPRNSLHEYKGDIVLAIEFNISRLAFFASTLGYYQSHPDVRNLEAARPIDALTPVVEGQAVLLLIDESLDLTLLIDHGFTRLFVQRLHEELGFSRAIGFIRQRVHDASASLALRSSVVAAENTSKKALAAAVKNNQIQSDIRRLAIVAIVVAAIVGGISWTLATLLDSGASEIRLDDPLCIVEVDDQQQLATCEP